VVIRYIIAVRGICSSQRERFYNWIGNFTRLLYAIIVTWFFVKRLIYIITILTLKRYTLVCSCWEEMWERSWYRGLCTSHVVTWSHNPTMRGVLELLELYRNDSIKISASGRSSRRESTRGSISGAWTKSKVTVSERATTHSTALE